MGTTFNKSCNILTWEASDNFCKFYIMSSFSVKENQICASALALEDKSQLSDYQLGIILN